MELTLSDPWFDLTRRGLKVYEGRRNIEKFQNLRRDDIITFYRHIDKSEQPFKVRVRNIYTFSTFKDALKNLDINKVLPIPGITVDFGCAIYHTYVSQQTQEKEGVIMIEIELV